MKKSLFILATAAIALASCSNDKAVAINETLNDANEITFHPLVPRIMRAADIDGGTLHSSGFRVTAFQTGTTSSPYFANVDFTWNGTGYYSDNKYYWPNEYNLDFYAWAPSSLSSNYASIAVTPGTTISSQTDLVYGKATNWGKLTGSSGQNDGRSGVTINFRHAESKVIVQLKNTNSNLFFTVKDVKIGYLADAGTFTYTAGNSGETSAQDAGNLSNADWTLASNHDGVYPLANAASTAYNGAATQVGEDMILIPQTLTAATVYSGTTAHVYESDPADDTNGSPFNGAYIMVEYKAQNTNSSGAYIVGAGSGNREYVKAIWPLTEITWTPGYKYTYTVDLAGGGYFEDNQDTNVDLDPVLESSEIMFATVTVDGWDASAYTIMNVVAGTDNNVSMEAASANFVIYVSGMTAGNSLTLTNDNDIFDTDPSTSATVPTGGTAVITGVISANESDERTSTITLTETSGKTTNITITQAGV